MKTTQYQPKTGAKCSCRPGVQRDNCPQCEGTGWVIDFRAIRAKRFFTHKDTLEKLCTHRQYYAQFVTEGVKRYVASAIGTERLLASKDEHLNDIPLHLWDRLEPAIRGMCLSRMGDIEGHTSKDQYGRRMIGWSLCDSGCIAKEAARQIIEEETVKQIPL